jgi:phytoene dehydrogenase-like protein
VKYDAIVLGAGPNGLVAALALAKRGKKVVVLEAAKAVGGHTRTIEFAPGFRAPIVEEDGAILRNVWKLFPAGSPAVKRLTRVNAMSVLDDSGKLLTLKSWSHRTDNELAPYSKRDAERWPAWLKRFSGFQRVMSSLYQLPPADIDTTSIGDVLALAAVGLKTRLLGRKDMIEFLRVMPMSVQDLVDDEFESEPIKAAIASAAVRDLRQGPRSGGTVFNLVHYMSGDAALRCQAIPADGPDAFALGAADLLRQLGAEVRTGADVARITVRDGAVTGVALKNGDEISAPIVISTADPKRTLLGLVEPQWLDPEIGLAVQNIKLRGCTAVVMYATDAPLPDTFYSPVSLTATTVALEKAADAAKYGEVSAEPHVEAFAPTLRWASLAPAGKHVLVARAQYAPYALKAGWSKEEAASLEKKVTAAIARVIPNFSGTVKHSRVLTPRDIETEFGATEGALTHGEIMLDQIMFMRPIPGWGRYAMPIRGLFLGGEGAHPGPGILGGAGYLAAKAAL